MGIENDSLFEKKERKANKREIASEPTQKSSVFVSGERKLSDTNGEYWKVLIVDDDKDIHAITSLALKDFTYRNKKIKFINTFSGNETKPILKEHDDIALILLDVVMESTHAGLDLVRYIRNDIGNQTVRIILRTGHPGYAPEREAIQNYEINDYKTKTELTATNLFIMVLSGLRAYEALYKLEIYNKELEQKVKERTAEIQIKNIELEKLSIVASNTDNAVVIASPDGEILWVNEGFQRLYGYSSEDFDALMGRNVLDVSFNPDFNSKFIECLNLKNSVNFIALTMTQNSRELWVQTNLMSILEDDGNIKYLVAMDTDITKTKEAEEEIKFLYESALSRKDEIEEQKIKIENQKKDIDASIEYAKRIQNSILPPQSSFNVVFPESFVLYKPRDVVSGDFYFYAEIGDIHIIVVTDCTGHGVPGAFMSLIGYDHLNQIIYKEGIVNPSEILYRLDNAIVVALDTNKTGIADGMDLCICCIDKNKMELQFAGANQDLLLMRELDKSSPERDLADENTNVYTEGELVLFEHKGSSCGIGKDEARSEKKFTTKKIQLTESDCLYMMSDGFVDQFGGKNDQKYKINRFRDFLFGVQSLNMEAQRVSFNNELESWKGKTEQIDDITLLGLKIVSSSLIEDILFDDEDITFMKDFITILDRETIYNTGNIISILETMDTKSDSVNRWKDAIMKAVYSFDEESFNTLINLARDKNQKL